MTDLQQRTPAWHAARRGKLTCSNLGALLGQVSYTSRTQAYRRALGTEKFTGNNATQWGTDNEQNGITAYMAKTGNVVQPTGLHVHKHYKWLAGSPDGLIGDEGMIEVKCPYFHKRDGSSRIHQTVPGHYWMQINALLEITGRKWCDYVCWTPEGESIYRVYKDSDTFDYFVNFYSVIYASITALSPTPPPLDNQQKVMIAARVDEAIRSSVDLKFWSANIQSTMPDNEDSDAASDADQIPPTKRQRIYSPDTEGAFSDTSDTSSSEAVFTQDHSYATEQAGETLLAICNPQVSLQAAAS